MSDAPICPSVEQSLVDQLAGRDILVNACYQCGRCSAGCPVSGHFDLLTMEVVRLAGWEMEDELLASKTIWLCASCETCTTRCPNSIEIAGLMDFLRQRALERNVKPAEKRVAAFHRSFLRSVRRWGRTYEVGMLAAYKSRSGDLFGDLKLGWAMFRRGKLHLLPRGIRSKKEVKRLFKKGRKGESE